MPESLCLRESLYPDTNNPNYYSVQSAKSIEETVFIFEHVWVVTKCYFKEK